MKTWIDYRWDEGFSVISNHINYHQKDNHECLTICVSKRFADYCLKSRKEA